MSVVAVSALAHGWLILHRVLPLWHMDQGIRGRIWYAAASRSWYWWERKEGRIPMGDATKGVM